jgi:hypothetical protein
MLVPEGTEITVGKCVCVRERKMERKGIGSVGDGKFSAEGKARERKGKCLVAEGKSYHRFSHHHAHRHSWVARKVHKTEHWKGRGKGGGGGHEEKGKEGEGVTLF